MKSTKTHNTFIQLDDTILMSKELAGRVNTSSLKTQLLGMDDRNDDLTLVVNNRHVRINELNLLKETISIVCDITLFSNIIENNSVKGSLYIKSNRSKEYCLALVIIKNLKNGEFNYTFKILNNEEIIE